MIFIRATIAGPYQTDNNGDVYAVQALWWDNGNFRCSYSQIPDPNAPGSFIVNDYPQMVIDFAQWPDANGDYPDPAVYAAAAQWDT